MTVERGIVVSGLELESTGDSISIRGAMPPEKLRYYLLYWDRIVVTDTNIFGCGLSPEQQLLEQASVLRKQTARLALNGTFGGSELARLHNVGLAQVTSGLISRNPGQWSLHQSGKNLVLPHGMSTEVVCADIQLNNCLPVPTASIPLQEVLEFKQRRADELAALRQTLDELYLEVVSAADIPRAKIAAISRLERAIADLDRVAAVSWVDRLFASRKVSLDVNAASVGQGVVTAGTVGVAFSNPVVGLAAGMAHTVLASVKCEMVVSRQLKEAAGKQLELSYLAELKAAGLVEPNKS